jgi:hypothetical protein
MGEPNKVLLPVRHDAHSAFADLQCKHKRGNGVAGFMVKPCFRACVSGASLALLRHGKSSVGFGPYRKTNPQNGEDHIGDRDRQKMKGCRNHQNYSD